MTYSLSVRKAATWMVLALFSSVVFVLCSLVSLQFLAALALPSMD